jgi:hypothetical protein
MLRPLSITSLVITRVYTLELTNFHVPRFDGALNVDLTEFQTNLVPYPRIHFPLAGTSSNLPTIPPFGYNNQDLRENLATIYTQRSYNAYMSCKGL